MSAKSMMPSGSAAPSTIQNSVYAIAYPFRGTIVLLEQYLKKFPIGKIKKNRKTVYF